MISAKQFNQFANDPTAFREALTVDVDGRARRFGEVMADWQRNDFAALDPALQRCNGRKPNAPGPSRAFYTRPRGCSKTTDLATTCCWALAFSQRPIRGYCFASDKDQARLLRDAMATLTRLNPWLGEILTVEAHRVVVTAKDHPGEGGLLEISSSDVGSSFGILPDLVICDELTNWQGDGSLWHSLISSAAKRQNCLLVIISNAGFVDSWQWSVRETARTDSDNWIFSHLDQPASWMSPARIAEMKRMLPPVAFSRLVENCWSSGGGDALTREDIAAAFVTDLGPMTGKEPGWLFVGGCDLGLTRDAAAVCILAVLDGGRSGPIRLARARLWKPVPGQKVDLMSVERYILAMDALFGLEFCSCDSWQAELLMQRLEANSEHRRRNQRRIFGSQPWMRDTPPTAANLRAQASLVIESFGDRRLKLYDYPPLREDLHKLRVEEKSYGFRLTSPQDASGHGDSFSAFALALLMAHEIAGKRPIVAGVIGADGYGVNTDQSGDWILPGDPRSISQGLRDGGAYDVCRREFEMEQQEFAEEQRLFVQPPDDQAPFREWMRENTPRVL